MNDIQGEQRKQFEICKRKLALIDRIIKKNDKDGFFKSLAKKVIICRYALVLIECGEKEIFEMSKQIEKDYLLKPDIGFQFFAVAYLSLRGKINFFKYEIDNLCTKFRQLSEKDVYLGEILIKRKNLFSIQTWKEHEVYLNFQTNTLKLSKKNKNTYQELNLIDYRAVWIGKGNEQYKFELDPFQKKVSSPGSSGSESEGQSNTILFGSINENEAVNFFSFLIVFTHPQSHNIHETIYTEEQIKGQQNFEQKRVFYLSSSKNYLLNIMIKDDVSGIGVENANLKIKTSHLFQQDQEDQEEKDYFDYGYKNLDHLASFHMTTNLTQKQQTDLLKQIEQEDQEIRGGKGSDEDPSNLMGARRTVAIIDMKKSIEEDHLKIRKNIMAEIDEIQNEENIHHQLIENDVVDFVDENLAPMSQHSQLILLQQELDIHGRETEAQTDNKQEEKGEKKHKKNSSETNEENKEDTDDNENTKKKTPQNTQNKDEFKKSPKTTSTNSKLFQSMLKFQHTHHNSSQIEDGNNANNTSNNSNNNNSENPNTNPNIEQRDFPFNYILHAQSAAGKNMRGQSQTNQDAMVVIDNFAQNKKQKFMGVFDGHGKYGHKISQFVKSTLPLNIESFLSEPPKNPDQYFSETISLLQEAFLQTQKEILELGNDGMVSGTTAICVYLDGQHLFCMNLGDSKAIIVQQVVQNPSSNEEFFLEQKEKPVQTTWEVKPISKEQRANNYFEYLRIISSGGRVSQDQNNQGPFRVCHPLHGFGLCMSRSLGDGILGTVGVISLPEIFCHQICPDDRFLVIASDGLWEFIINNQVVSYITEFYKKKDPKGAVQVLIAQSERLWLMQEKRSDDISIILMFFYHDEDEVISATN